MSEGLTGDLTLRAPTRLYNLEDHDQIPVLIKAFGGHLPRKTPRKLKLMAGACDFLRGRDRGLSADGRYLVTI